MSDESLDNLFKKGLSGREVNFNMESWRKMEQMLPPETKAAGFKFSAVAAIIGAIFILSTSVIIWNISGDSTLAENPNDLNESSVVADIEKEYDSGNTELIANDAKAINSEQSKVLSANDSDDETISQTEAKNRTDVTTTVVDVDKRVNEPSSNNKTLTSNTLIRAKVTKVSASNTTKASNTQPAFFNQSNSFYSKKGRSESFTEEEISLSSNAFTSISGLSELNSLTVLEEEEDNTLFASVSEGKLPKADNNKLGVIGGININKSLTENPSGGISGCEFFGVTYERFLNGGLSIKSNLLYSARNEVNAVKFYDKKVYGFGSKTQQTKVEAQRLAYLELPVMVNYGIGNHNFMTGASFSYLISGLHEVSTEYTTPTETTYENDMQWGYTNGFKSYDVAIVAGYEYNVNPKLNLGLRLNYGLLDVTDNTYFGVDSFDNNVQFRVYLTYSPFQF
jgi:hypothetical protein